MIRKFLMAAAVCVAAGHVHAATANLINGDFESGWTGATGLVKQAGNWRVYTDIDGWTTTAGQGIELQTNATLGGIDSMRAFDDATGNYYVELDSHPRPGNSSMAQTIANAAAGSYTLSFHFAPRVNTTGGTNQIFYSIGNVSGSVSGPSAAYPRFTWTEVTETFSFAGGDLTLEFSAFDPALLGSHLGGDTLGGLLDNVSLSYNGPLGAPTPSVPVPAGVLLLGSAAGGLMAMRRATKR